MNKKPTMAEKVQANKRMNQSEVRGNRGIHPAYPNKRTKERAAARKLKEAKKKALPPQLRKPGKPTGRTLAKVLKKKKS